MATQAKVLNATQAKALGKKDTSAYLTAISASGIIGVIHNGKMIEFKRVGKRNVRKQIRSLSLALPTDYSNSDFVVVEETQIGKDILKEFKTQQPTANNFATLLEVLK